MATQPEARALGRRGGNREREGCWEAWPSVWLPRLSFHAAANWTWHFIKRKGEKKKNGPQHWSSLWTDVWLTHPSPHLWFICEKKRERDRSDQDIHDNIHIITGVYVVDVMSLNSGGLSAVQPLRLNSVTVTVGSLSLHLWQKISVERETVSILTNRWVQAVCVFMLQLYVGFDSIFWFWTKV